MNDYQFKIVNIQGDFVWHTQEETDESFSFWTAIFELIVEAAT